MGASLRRGLRCAANGVAVCALILVAASHASAQQPASRGQLAAWQSQKTSLQAQQQTAWADKESLRVQQQTISAEITALTAQENLIASMQKNELLLAAQARAEGISVAQKIIEVNIRHVDVKNRLNELRAERAALVTRDAQLGTAIAQRDAQIAQLEKSIAYYSNPGRGDLQNERTRLQGLNKQKPTSDDAGQLGWDIENTKRRIKDLEALEQQFQQPGGRPGGGSAGQAQASGYVAPTRGSGAQQGPADGGLGFGYGPGYGPSGGSGSTRRPDYRDLMPGGPTGSSGGGCCGGGSGGGAAGGGAAGGGSPGAGSGGGSHCHQRPDGTMHCGGN